MSRLFVLILVAVALLGVAGCFSYDPAHNAYHWSLIRKDLQTIHTDVDFMTGFDAPSHVDRTQY
jgi:hypothetical protein